ncbi:hypothetical protein [Ornithinimicrobium tianjinense]|uniref:Uncharacterized protein n=1 Tax=Ornithinimicrobium tianjinense TaxID=1195761 RepID=A0A917BQW9_9MICO|nr:hypothetical protein [Ornithinimicrobium tianjinense]GGF54213.1 hypothetical protein GCM10011366_22570 [Ornithinimicrobium tianjinense]
MLRVVVLTVVTMLIVAGVLWLVFSAGRMAGSRHSPPVRPAPPDDLPRIDTPQPPLPRPRDDEGEPRHTREDEA